MKKHKNFSLMALFAIFSFSIVSCGGGKRYEYAAYEDSAYYEDTACYEVEESEAEKARLEAEEKARKDEEERLKKGEIVIGSNGEFYLNELKEEAYKKGFEDGYNGYSGWDALNSFELWLTYKLGTPQSNEQKENLKKCKSVLDDEYSRGLKEGWPY